MEDILESRTTIACSRSSFCNIFYNWKGSRGPQEKPLWAPWGPRAVCCAGMD